MTGLVYFILDAFLLAIAVFFLLRRRRITGKVGFSLLMETGLWKTAVEGFKKSVVVFIIPPLVERPCLRLLGAVSSFISGHRVDLLSQAYSHDFLGTLHEFSWVKYAIGFGMLELVILGPIAEEVFFRGLLYPAMRTKWNANVSMTLNALLFAVIHITPYGFIGYFLTGLLLCWSFERTRSILIPIVAHALTNVPGFVVILRQ